ncbi:unnamed protein product [Symbiodinium sp. CCMP2456]|nr:unnamed protein product [Symbiodinium sp. CCMP2456]
MGKRLEDVSSVQISGCELACLNRTYRHEPGAFGAFKDRAAPASHWLYYAADSRWHFGSSFSKNAGQLDTALRSRVCDDSSLPPPDSAPWEERVLLFGRVFGFKSSPARVRCEFLEDCQAAWNAAKSSGACNAIHVTNCEISEINALYDLLPGEDGQAPRFRQRGKDAWLYYAIDGRWHFGSGVAAAQNLPGHRFRSRECKAGTLPVDTSSWEVRDMRDLGSGSKRPSSFTASSARLVRLASDDWSWCKDIWSAAAAVEISGARCGDTNGCYELQHCRRESDGSPVFKHRTAKCWLYFASDRRWYAGGDTDDMNLWASRGLLRSSTCAAGTLPGEIHVWEEKSSLYGGYVRTKACRVSAIPGPQLGIFKAAVFAAPAAVQVSGAAADNWNGKYFRQVHSSCPTRLPTFCKTEADAWLYQCDDGRWYVGQKKHKDKRCAGRGLRSSVCDVGVLPFLAAWDEHRWRYTMPLFEPTKHVKVLED